MCLSEATAEEVFVRKNAFVSEWWQITARTLFVAAQVLAEHPEGLGRRELWEFVTAQLPDIDAEWQGTTTGQTTAFQNFDRYSVNMVKAGWMRKTDRRWYLTPVGRDALHEFPGPESFWSRHALLYDDWLSNRARFDRARLLIDAIPYGNWVSVGDIAGEAQLDSARLTQWAQGERPPGWYKVLDRDGGLLDVLPLTDGERNEWLELLETDGVTIVGGRAQPGERITGPDLSQLVLDESAGDVRRRAWLIRGSSVQGVNLVRDLWLSQGVCSLPASRLQHDLLLGATREEIRAAIDADYSYATVQQRARMAAEYHAFLSRMRIRDIVVTNDGSEVFLGVVTGPPGFVSSIRNTANLQRPVTWRNANNPVDYTDLPDEMSARLGNPDAELIELTEFVGHLEQFLGEEPEQAVPDRDMRLPDITQDFAESLYMPNEEGWLQECVELLRERPQLIFYGPPGTGKTYMAQELANYLTGGKRENVQLVQFHPAYSYEDFFEGYRPMEANDGTVSFRLRRGPLRLLADAAVNRPGDPHVLIIDEINRGNLAKVFGELYFLLEYRGRAVSLLYGSDKLDGSEESKQFTLPRNLIIIGTMNTADRSIALVDAAMRRRFWFVELHPDVTPVRGLLATWLARNEFPPDAALLLDELNEDINDRDFRIGPSYLMRPGVQSVAGIARVWRNQILPLLEEHHYGEFDQQQVIDRYGLQALRAELGLPEPGGFGS
jgi:5-methylcytosine-specific restriction enzyme B